MDPKYSVPLKLYQNAVYPCLLPLTITGADVKMLSIMIDNEKNSETESS